MEKITITKQEYSSLKRKAKAYEKLAASFYESSIKDPVESIVSDFKNTKLYTNEFLVDLEDGLKKSSIGRRRK